MRTGGPDRRSLADVYPGSLRFNDVGLASAPMLRAGNAVQFPEEERHDLETATRATKRPTIRATEVYRRLGL
jgi:hypothetical protein